MRLLVGLYHIAWQRQGVALSVTATATQVVGLLSNILEQVAAVVATERKRQPARLANQRTSFSTGPHGALERHVAPFSLLSCSCKLMGLVPLALLG
jgi:hypothetical protein